MELPQMLSEVVLATKSTITLVVGTIRACKILRTSDVYLKVSTHRVSSTELLPTARNWTYRVPVLSLTQTSMSRDGWLSQYMAWLRRRLKGKLTYTSIGTVLDDMLMIERVRADLIVVTH